MTLDSPIFIVGAPRSGTNLLGNMLSRTSTVEICKETHFFNYAYRRRRSFGELRMPENRVRLVDAFLALDRTGWMRVDLRLLREYLLHEATDYRLFLAALLRFNTESHGKRRAGEQRADHRLAEKYDEWFPGAKILHIVRDPRDVVQSLMTMPWAPRTVVGNARFWLAENLTSLRLQGRPQYLQLKYENLARQPETELRRVCAFVGEAYTPEMLKPSGESKTAVPCLKRAEDAVSASRIGVWREAFSDAEVGLIEWIAGPLIETLGYKREGRPPSAGARLAARVREAVDAVQRHADEFPGSLYSAMGSTNIVAEEAAKRRAHNKRSPATA